MAAAAGGSGGPLKAIKEEAKKLHDKYPGKVAFQKEGQPFPVAITRTIPAPAGAEAWDVFEIVVKMVIAGQNPNDCPVWVEIPMPSMPSKLTQKWAAELEKKWKATLKDPRAKGKGWLLDMVLKFAEKRYVEWLKLEPSLIESYSTVDADDNTIRRFTITKPTELTEEEKEQLELERQKEAAEEAQAEYQWITKKLAAEEKALAEKEKEAQEKRRLADEGMLEYKPVQLSKKEEQARLDAKKKQGVRTAKTGERRHKFDLEATEAAKKEREKEKALKKKEARDAKLEKKEEKAAANSGRKRDDIVIDY